MLTMRDFVLDPRLHNALDEVELWMGYALPANPMPLEIQEEARCRMRLNKETGLFELLFIEGEPQSQTVYWHELAHLILWINGAVIKYDYEDPIPLLYYAPPVRLFLDIIWKYMQHVPVHALVKELGYDEIPDYDPVATGVIALIRQNLFYPVVDVHPLGDPIKDRMRCQAGALAQCLALPMEEETRDALRKVAQETIPQSLELADAILSALGPQTLLGQQEYQECISEICRLAELPRAYRQFLFLNKISPNFRSRILEVAML